MHMKNKHFNRLYMSCLWLQFQDKMIHKKTFTKKAPDIFCIQVQDVNISDVFYKILNLKKWKINAERTLCARVSQNGADHIVRAKKGTHGL